MGECVNKKGMMGYQQRLTSVPTVMPTQVFMNLAKNRAFINIIPLGTPLKINRNMIGV